MRKRDNKFQGFKESLINLPALGNASYQIFSYLYMKRKGIPLGYSPQNMGATTLALIQNHPGRGPLGTPAAAHRSPSQSSTPPGSRKPQALSTEPPNLLSTQTQLLRQTHS